MDPKHESRRARTDCAAVRSEQAAGRVQTRCRGRHLAEVMSTPCGRLHQTARGCEPGQSSSGESWAVTEAQRAARDASAAAAGQPRLAAATEAQTPPLSRRSSLRWYTNRCFATWQESVGQRLEQRPQVEWRIRVEGDSAQSDASHEQTVD